MLLMLHVFGEKVIESNNENLISFVANIGGGRENSISIAELIKILDTDFGLRLKHNIIDEPGLGIIYGMYPPTGNLSKSLIES